MFDSVDAADIEAIPAGPTAAVPGPSLRSVAAATDTELLEQLAAAAPSAAMSVTLDRVDVQCLDAHDRAVWLRLWDRQRAWHDARMQDGLVAVGGPAPADHREDDWAREEIACALRLSSSTAGSRLDVARELTGRLADTGAALQQGHITYWHARYLADSLASHPDPVALLVQRQALTGGHADETLTNWRKRVDRAVIAADPRTADERHDAAVATQKVICYPEDHGLATVAATVTADVAMTAMRALTALAHQAKTERGDDRPIDLRRADAFADLFAAALAAPSLPSEQRARPAIGVTIDAATLLKLADHPAQLDGYGPIPPAMARRIAAGGDWHRLVTDPISGALLDKGRTSYRPTVELAEYITARDRTCRFPTCNRPARLCDLDHAIPFDDGGETSAGNCGALCRRNHRQKTHTGWALHSHPDGAATFTSPTGHTYTRPAIDHCPEHTAHLRAMREQKADREGDPPEPPDEWDPDSEQFAYNREVQYRAERARERHDSRQPDPTSRHADTSSGHDPPPF